MAKLIPSILTKDPEEIHEKIRFLEQIPELAEIQIDFADGKFVSNELAYPRDIGKLDTRLALEAHLMVQRPQDYFHDLEFLGVQTVFLHHESFHSNEQVGIALRNLRHLGFRCGLAVNPSTEIAVFDQFVDHLDEALLMGVYPGLQGQEFIAETLERVAALRKRHPNVIIEVDGGIKLFNVESIVGYGADKVNVGSGIWQTPDPKKTISEFLRLLRSTNLYESTKK